MAGFDKFKPHVVSQSIGPRAQGPGGDVQRLAANALGQLGRVVGDMADRAAIADGETRGALAGMDPEFRPTGDDSLRGQAFDAAALRSHASMLDGAIRGDLATLFDATQHDPVAFEAGAAEIYRNRIANLPAQIQPALAAAFERQTFAYTRDLSRRQQELIVKQEAASLNALMSERTTDFGRMAYTLGLDPDADERLSAESEDILAKLLEFGPKEAFTYAGRQFAADPSRGGLLDPDAIGKQMTALAEEAAINRFKGAFDRTKGLAGQQKFLEDFKADWAAGEGVARAIDTGTAEQLGNWMEARIREGMAEQRAAAAAIRAEISDIRAGLTDYRAGVKDGLMPPPGVIESFMARARATGNADVINQVASFAQLAEIGGQAARMSPLQLQEEINAARAALSETGATPDQAAMVEMLETTLSGMTTALERDPLSWAQRAGVVNVPPLAFEADPETGTLTVAPDSLRARRGAAQQVSATYGVPIRPFTDEEAALAKTIEAQGGENMLGLARSIVTTFGSDAPAALAQLSDKAPSLAHLGGLMAQGSDAGTLRAAALGFELMKDKQGVRTGLPEAQNITATGLASSAMISRSIGRALSEQPEFNAEAERVAQAIYVGRRGLNSTYDPQAYVRAAQEATGAVYVNGVQYGGVARGLHVPSWLRADAIEDVLGSLSPADLAAAGPRGKPVDGEGKPLSAAAMKALSWVSVGPGQYQLRDRAGAYVFADSDQPYVLDLNRLRGRARVEWQEFGR